MIISELFQKWGAMREILVCKVCNQREILLYLV